MTFLGSTYSEPHDKKRLSGQKERVLMLVVDGFWRTLHEISEITGDPEASVSARLRDFRREGYTVNRRRRGDPSLGHHEYQVLKQEEKPEFRFIGNQGIFI